MKTLLLIITQLLTIAAFAQQGRNEPGNDSRYGNHINKRSKILPSDHGHGVYGKQHHRVPVQRNRGYYSYTPNYYYHRGYTKQLPVSYAGIVLYEHGYSGNFITITNNWNACNIWYDRVSSIRVPFGYKIIVYDQPNFRGRSMVLASDWASPGGSCVWNNHIRSIQIIRTPAQVGYYYH